MTPGYEYEQPFDLVDHVAMPGQKPLNGAHARVYDLLRQTAERGYQHRIGVHLGPPGWVPNHLLRAPWAGGGEGVRRVRQLRTDWGVAVSDQRFVDPTTGETTHTWLYALPSGALPAQVSPANFGGEIVDSPPSGDDREGRRPTPAPAGLRFYTNAGVPAGADGLCVTPGRGGVLAAPGVVALKVIRAEWAPAKAVEEYESFLRRRWLSGELGDVLEREGDVVIWSEVASAFNPLPVLERVLVACGATFLGPWPGRQSAAA